VLPALFGFQLGPGQGYVEALTPEQQHQAFLSRLLLMLGVSGGRAWSTASAPCAALHILLPPCPRRCGAVPLLLVPHMTHIETGDFFSPPPPAPPPCLQSFVIMCLLLF